MLKTLLRVRLAAFAAYFTGASRSQKKRSGAQKIGMLLLLLYCFAAFGMLFYTSFSALAGVYAKLSLGWLYFAMYAVAAFALMVFGTVFRPSVVTWNISPAPSQSLPVIRGVCT